MSQSKTARKKPQQKKPRPSRPGRRLCRPATRAPRKRLPVYGAADIPLGLCADDATSVVNFGLRPGDHLTLKPADDPQPRQILFMHRHEGNNWDVGRFVGFSPFDEQNPGIAIDQSDGEGPVTFNLTFWRAYHITEITPYQAPADPRLDKLRAELQRLGYEPENEAAQLKVESEMFAIEHAPAEPADEWEGFDLVNSGPRGCER